MIGRRPAIIAGAVLVSTCAVLGAIVTGCAEPGSRTPSSPAASTPSAAPSVPSVAELDAVLARAVSPSADLRRGTVEGDGTDFQLIDWHPEAPVFAYPVIAVRPESTSRVLATVRTTIDGTPIPDTAEVPFVFEGTSWKIERNWMCATMSVFERPSSDC
ncbi:hypothetical protein AB0H71_14355 [Nocardia sp. NPDC050697]|uniref:hypothetical protein n=1 Tax=Nocardia sp. NPDC050697 TaxID=3155158 RepID=UPI0033E9CF62